MAPSVHDQLVRSTHKTFPTGYTALTGAGTPQLLSGIRFGIHVLTGGQSHTDQAGDERLWVLLSGNVEISVKDPAGPGITTTTLTRHSIFDEAPSAVHAGPGALLTIKALSPRVEWAMSATGNENIFPSRLYLPKDVEFEYRGKGLVQNACLRNVRCIFDHRTRPESNLVCGEVVNFPGRWSSYPPHHHDQPEIYHYRFTLPQGYGHAELGDEVTKVFEGDTVVIGGGEDHAQVSAPGYGMYYLWVVRHLPGNPYKGFEFTKEHQWLLDANNQGWMPPAEALK